MYPNSRVRNHSAVRDGRDLVRRSLPIVLMMIVALIASVRCAAAHGATFRDLGNVEVLDVSSDGAVAVGRFWVPGVGQIGFRWTATSGIIPMPTGQFSSDVAASAVHGGTFAGTMVAGPESIPVPFRWRSGTGAVELELPPLEAEPFAESVSGWAAGISDDGLTVAGTYGYYMGGDPLHQTAALWKFNHNGEYLGRTDLHSPGTVLWSESEASAISADGSVVLGGFWNIQGIGEWSSGYWTEQTGWVALENFWPAALSADGSVILGTRSDTTLRWTESTGAVPLTTPELAFTPKDVTADGSIDNSVIVGAAGLSLMGPPTDTGAVVWDARHGARRLSHVLEELRFPMAGWWLGDAVAISGDARVIAGTGRNPCGQKVSWVLDLGGDAGPPGVSPNDPLLPESAGPTFDFTLEIGATGLGADQPIFLDPVVAVGYDYVVESGPNFRSVTLPGIGDGVFDLLIWNGAEYVFEDQLSAWQEYFFDSADVSRFRVLGIEETADLDPDDPLAFPTGVTFLSEGSVSVSMIPIAVPEPCSLVLFGVGAASLLILTRRRRNP